MKKGTIAAAALVASMIFGQTAFAQGTATPPAQEQQDALKFSDAELKKFIEVNGTVTELQKEGRQAMVSAIKDANLTVDRFNALAKAHRQDQLKEVAENKEEIDAFIAAAKSLAEVQPETKKKIESAIEEADLTVEKYESIMEAFQEDPAVETRIKVLLSAK
ncbi:DUF4168 domain-containing protein [Pontibacter sp. MBLB2868]|uniref:DUF4168 domain-containing protein n=1 Tax=Pontibacter sp. MBLB2868 TaxID=3451555 RepID=UPI003F74BAB5